jgi:lysophospholipase L1-like esterase
VRLQKEMVTMANRAEERVKILASFGSALLLVALIAPATAQQAAAPAAAADKWETTIAQFEAEDKKTPPPHEAVLFVGSSSIRLWDLKKSFPDVATINRGFGGSQMSDVVRYAGRIITPYKPRLIVLYEGDNDLAAKKPPEQVVDDFTALLKAVRAELPTTPIVVIGTKPSPKRWELINQQRALNRLVADRCQADGHATFLDVERPMLAADGQAKGSLFREDKLHLNDEGYRLWTSLVAPLIAPAK